MKQCSQVPLGQGSKLTPGTGASNKIFSAPLLNIFSAPLLNISGHPKTTQHPRKPPATTKTKPKKRDPHLMGKRHWKER